MRAYMVMLGAAALVACECEGPPETYKDGNLSGGYIGETYECATYSSYKCEYVLCQEDTACGWHLTNWACW